MDNKHTPGPWHIVNPHDEPYYEIWHGELGDATRQCIAEYVYLNNAALIAAAPALLKALTVASRLLNEYVKSHQALVGGCSLEWQDAAYEARLALTLLT